MPAREGIIFMHIPKTAGITLHSILVRQYPWHKNALFPNLEAMESFKSMPEKKRHGYDVLRGHLDASLLPCARPGLPVITFLREPFRRVLSGYEYIKRQKKHKFHGQMVKNNYSLYEFLEGQYLTNFDNGQVRFLSGAHEEAFGTIHEQHLQLAKYNLDHLITAFGITERFDESILHMAHVLNWKTPWYKSYNSSHYDSSSAVDDQTRNKIKACNFYDDQLYTYATERLNEILLGYGTAFQKETEQFQHTNARKNWWFEWTEPYFHFKIRS